jgi:hypothetical protein
MIFRLEGGQFSNSSVTETQVCLYNSWRCKSKPVGKTDVRVLWSLEYFQILDWRASQVLNVVAIRLGNIAYVTRLEIKCAG